MDLLSTVRKSGSRGGVNFSWDEVASSSHRENYLGHSLKAPVGRWQQGRDLNWYAKADSTGSGGPVGETDEERQQRERKEELRRVKEAEEDAMAAALGLPPPQRNTSGSNAIEVLGDKTEKARDLPAAPDKRADKGKEPEDGGRHKRSKRHDDRERRGRDGHRRRHHHHRHHHRSHSRSRSRSRSRNRGDRHERHRHREVSRENHHPEDRPRRMDRSRGLDERRDLDNQDGRVSGRNEGRWRSRSRERSRRDRSRSPRARRER